VRYLRLLAASGRCPPEDIGGPWLTPKLIKQPAIRSANVLTGCFLLALASTFC